MKDIGAFLRSFIEKNRLVQKEVAASAGFSREHFWQLLQKPDMTCSQLERICDALGLNPGDFFECDSKVSNPSQVVSTETDFLLLREKDERIKALEKNVSLLEDMLSMYRDNNGTNSAKKA